MLYTRPIGRNIRLGVSCAQNLPSDDSHHAPSVLNIARNSLYDSLSNGVRHLSKAALLVALEEEAAACIYYKSEEPLQRSVGTSSTWSLERLQSLAAEAQSLLPPNPSATAIIDAVCTVLFTRHGYTRRQGVDPRHSLLNRVLESGRGTSVMLSILFMDLCARCGLPMTAAALDYDYVLCWPLQPEALSACGEQFVIDPYSQGALFSVQEVVELFALSTIEELRSYTVDNTQLLCISLYNLQQAYFTSAQVTSDKMHEVCSLTLRHAVDGGYVALTEDACRPGPVPLCMYFLQRTLAAAERRARLLPDDGVAAMHEALLLYIMKRYDEAGRSLEAWIDRFGGGEYGGKIDDNATHLLHKCNLMKSFDLQD